MKRLTRNKLDAISSSDSTMPSTSCVTGTRESSCSSSLPMRSAVLSVAFPVALTASVALP